ncbi:inorganic diphosphatase [Streptomyces reniochalinae]|uniref:inorganic diphosphatase n=1 Tax=Streptomyces reniochalinae TaxID=2250578 RepID=UPI0015EFF78B|nr:inorganic diphosphatase [Streptomyces reniochalinae]
MEATAGSPFHTGTEATPALSFADHPLLTGCAVGQGFIEDTLEGDGEPVDVLVLLDEPALPGCSMVTRPVARVLVTVDGSPGDLVICVQHGPQSFADVAGLADLRRWHVDDGTSLSVLRHFGPDRSWEVQETRGQPDASALIRQSKENYAHQQGN